MKIKILLFIIINSIFFSCSHQENKQINLEIVKSKMRDASNYYSIGEYKNAIQELNKLVEKDYILKEFKRERTSVFYDLACNYALIGSKNSALDCLEKSVQFGYANFQHIENDNDLTIIRNDERFINLVSKLKKEQNLWENKSLNTPYAVNISDVEKIAGLSKLWSEIKYNFVNFDIINDINLDSLYMNFLPKVIATQSTNEYYWCLKKFCTHFKDGHTNVIFPKEIQNQIQGRIPIQSRLVEGKVIVTEVYDKELVKKGIAPGYEITHVNNFTAKNYADLFVRPYWTSNSTHGLNRTIFEYALFRGPVGEAIDITIKNQEEKSFTHKINRQRWIYGKKWVPVNYIQLGNNIGYVSINSFGNDEVLTNFDSVFYYIEKNEALIIDLRDNGGGNGRIGWAILAYFTDKPFEIFKWKTRMYRPIWRAWGRKEEVYEEQPAQEAADETTYYSKPVVLLTRPRTGSMAENFCMGFRIMNRGKIIGGPTAGSSGTPLVFSMPGGGSAKVVTTRGMYPDGKEFIGIGIEPDILVTPTIDDFRIGYDRILETAIDYLNNNQ